MAYASYMFHNGGKRFYDFTGPDGSTITEKGSYEQEARRAAAERLNCDASELICTGHKPVNIQYRII